MKTAVATTAAAIALLSQPALAGSSNAAAPEPVVLTSAGISPSGQDWTGFYGGVQLGYANIDTNVPGVDGDGFIGGLIAGYDYDFGTFVLGGGLDYDFSDITLTPGVNVDNVFRAKVRGGVELGNGLLYATGGYAQADASLLGTEDGYFIGAGYDYLINDQFSVGGEVLYHEFNNYGPTTIDVEATTFQIRGAFRF
ncbi:MAG: outer membrane beta-barrel protein [Pseudomonadota bacterium]